MDPATGVIHVRRGWDASEDVVFLKSGKQRRVPITVVLRDYLDEHMLRRGYTERLMFGTTAAQPFNPGGRAERADAAWTKAKLARITLHEWRHTFASLMIAADVNAKALSAYMGHANITITMDRYGHLMPGNDTEPAGLLDAYLVRATSTAGAIPGAQLART